MATLSLGYEPNPNQPDVGLGLPTLITAGACVTRRDYDRFGAVSAERTDCQNESFARGLGLRRRGADPDRQR